MTKRGNIFDGVCDCRRNFGNIIIDWKMCMKKFLCRDTNEIIKCNSYVEEPKLIEEQAMKQCMERTAARMPERKLDKKLDR